MIASNVILLSGGAQINLNATTVASTATVLAIANTNGPIIRLSDPDSATDEKHWRIRNIAGALQFVAENDSNVAATFPMIIDRTGTVIDSIQLGAATITLAATTLTNLTGPVKMQSSLVEIEHALPMFQLDETDAPANERSWLNYASGGELLLGVTATDAAPTTGVVAAIRINRTGTVLDSITLAATTITLSGAVTTGQLTPTGIVISQVAPYIVFNETDQSASEQNWGFLVNGNQWRFATLDSGMSPAANIMVVERTSTAVDSIALSAGNVTMSNTLQVLGGTLFLRGKSALHDANDGYLRLNNDSSYASGTYSPGVIRSGSSLRADISVANADGTLYFAWGPANIYGTCRVRGAGTAYHGLAIDDGTLNPVFMSNGAVCGIHVYADTKWIIYRASSTVATSSYTLEAPAFNVSSSRTLKRETGYPKDPQQVLARLRPMLYRLLADDSHEQLGMIAEEVYEVCPWLSRDGKTVSYDRLALLLLADWQQARGIEWEKAA
jgi:hypothetical protein